MSKTSVNQVIQRAVSDAAFRRQLQRDPAGTLAGFELTAEERAAITGGDPARLTSLGVDQRMSKAFVIGGLSGGASAVVTSDTGGAFTAALIDENVASASKSVIELDPGHDAGSGIIGDPEAASAAAIDSDTASPGLNAFDAGMLTRSAAALDDAARTEVTDINQDANWAGGAVTAFEPASEGAAPGLNTVDPGLLGPADMDTSFDVEVGTAARSAEESVRGMGGDIHPTEY